MCKTSNILSVTSYCCSFLLVAGLVTVPRASHGSDSGALRMRPASEIATFAPAAPERTQRALDERSVVRRSMSPIPRRVEPRGLDLNIKADLQLTAVGLMFSVAPYIINEPDADPTHRAYSPASLNFLDRTVVGNASDKAAVVSDTLMYSQIALPYLAAFVDSVVLNPAAGWEGFGKDSLILLETLAINNMVSNTIKLAFRRPRPYLYDPSTDDAERAGADATMSFFSGHTSISFAMATSYSYLFELRHPDSPLVLPVWLATHALAGTTGLMRVLAGKHFWTDVIIGAVVGSTIGYFVPHLHRKRARGEKRGWLSSLSFAPTVQPGGVGAAAMIRW